MVPPRPICLRVLRQDQPDAPVRHFSFDQDEVLIGRSENTDVPLDVEAVSLVHLRLLRRKGKLQAIDTGSTNGTWIDGRRLVAQEPSELLPGGRILVGPFVIELLLEGIRPTSTANEARQMVLAVLGGLGEPPKLEVIAGPNRGLDAEVPVRPAPFVIGRAEGCDLQLSDGDVSRHHLKLCWEEGGVLAVYDAGSKNGFWVNERRPDDAGGCALSHGDVVRIGGTKLRLTVPGGDLQPAGDAGSDSEQGEPAPSVPSEAAKQPGADKPLEASLSPPPMVSRSKGPLRPWRDPVAIIVSAATVLIAAALIAYLVY